MLAREDFYLILPSNTPSNHYWDNRPHHYKIELSQEILLQGEWEVGVTEISFFKTWYQPPKISLNETSDLTWQYSTGEGNPFVTKKLPPASYLGYYNIFEHVVTAMKHDLAESGVTTYHYSKHYSYPTTSRTVRWSLPAGYVLKIPISMARILGFVALKHPEYPEPRTV